jgi:hypothetical protein
MNLRIGPPATGSNFYKRPSLIAKLLRALRAGNIAFLGPRRTGKTSCLEEIKANPEGYLPILINLEKHDSPEAWLAAMLKELRSALAKPQQPLAWVTEKGRGFLERLEKIETPLGGLDISRKSGPPAWRRTADEFLALLVESDVPALFLLDEFPTFLKLVAKKSSAEDVESVLNWFRAARNDLKDRQARFLVTGSIGLKGVVKKLGLAPAVNEFDKREIPPLEESEALGLLESLATSEGVPLSTAGRRKILELLGANWPILLQLFISEIQEAGFKKAPTIRELEAIYHERLIHGSRNQYCDGMYDRLKDVFTSLECQLAREMLKAACRTQAGLTRDEFEAIHARLVPVDSTRAALADDFEHVLETLKHDGYLLQQRTGEQRTTFASHILRDFWLRKTA